jgi:hypothetical protein
MKTRYGQKLYGEYSFRDAFNPTYTYDSRYANGPTTNGESTPGWFDVDYLGIDQGPILLMAENARTQFVWNLMKRSPHVRRGLQRAGFTGGWLRRTTTIAPDRVNWVHTDMHCCRGGYPRLNPCSSQPRLYKARIVTTIRALLFLRTQPIICALAQIFRHSASHAPALTM